MATIFSLDKHKDLFRDPAAFAAFTSMLRGAAECTAGGIVICDEKILGTILSPEATQEILNDRIAARLLSNPKTLDSLKARLESDDIVE